MPKRALGRGLGALIPTVSVEKEIASARPSEVSLDSIVPNPFQPREEFEDRDFNSLVASVKEKGVLEPVLVRPSKGGYQLIAGERRFRAAKKVGLKSIPAVVRETTDQEMLMLALIENLQRSDLNPIEEALAYQRLMEEFKFSQESVARQVGKDRSTIANMLRLLHLPGEVQRMLKERVLSMGHARALLALENSEEQKNLARQIVRDQLSVREVEEMIKLKKPASANHRRPRGKGGRQDAQVTAMEEELQRLWGTKVKIKAKAHGGGSMEISFYSHDDFARILELLKGTP